MCHLKHAFIIFLIYVPGSLMSSSSHSCSSLQTSGRILCSLSKTSWFNCAPSWIRKYATFVMLISLITIFEDSRPFCRNIFGSNVFRLLRLSQKRVNSTKTLASSTLVTIFMSAYVGWRQGGSFSTMIHD